jgi:hypothetical protein
MIDRAQHLRGRRAECTTLERLTALARSGQSQVLVVRGEAGIGKTALLEFVATRAADFRPARVSGVESEMELVFAALHQLCTPLLDCIDGLPCAPTGRTRHRLRPPHRTGAGSIFGGAGGAQPDRRCN